MIVKTNPYAHQVAGFNAVAEILARGERSAALFMEMGTGKTKLSIDIVSNLFFDGKIDAVLLIAPNGIHTQWFEEQIPEHSPVAVWRFLWVNSKSKKYARDLAEFVNEVHVDRLKWFCVNVDRFSVKGEALEVFTEFLKRNRTAIIVDEATRIKNSGANRTETITKIGQGAAYRFILTGTPVTNSPFDVYSMFEFLRPGFWGVNFFTFRHRYGLLVKTEMNGRQFHRAMGEREFGHVRYLLGKGAKVEDVAIRTGIAESSVRYIMEHPDVMRPYKNLEELKTVIAPWVYSVKKDECLDLPEKIYQVMHVDMSDEQKRVYNELKKNMLTEYEGRVLSVQNKIAMAVRLQQITGGHFPGTDGEPGTAIGGVGPKLSALVAEIDEAGGEKVIVWCRFTAEIDQVVKVLRAEYPEKVIEAYYGKTDVARREEIKQEFQAGAIDVLVINQQVGSMGLNLQKATVHYFYSNSFSLEHRMQAEDRSHRIGQTKHVVYKDLVCRGTIDERVLGALKSNREVAEYFSSKELGELV